MQGQTAAAQAAPALARMAAGSAPVVGDVADAAEFGYDIGSGNYLDAFFSGLATAVPLVGAAAVKAGGKALLNAVDVLPMGFKSAQTFAEFGSSLKAGLRKAGFDDVTPLMQGSAVTGKKYTTGAAFDAGRKSDFDVALAGPSIMKKAKEAGIGLRGKGTRTGPLSDDDVAALGLSGLQKELSGKAGRDVNFMLFETAEAAAQKAPSAVIP